jgi:tape measure domain-containing protein
MNANDVSIIIRVNDTDAEKFAKVAAKTKLVGDAAGAASADLARLDATQRAAAASAARMASEQERAAKKLERVHTQAIVEDRARERAKTAAELAEIKKREAAELASQKKMEALHAAAIAEDIARERAKTAAIIREAEKQAAARNASLTNFGTGTLAYAGVGFGANALGAGIAAAGATYFASSTSIEFERAEQAITAVTGSLAGAQRQMQGVEFQAQRLGMSVTDLARLYSKFEAASKGTTLEGEKARDIFYAVAEAAQRLSLRGEQVDGVLRAIEQMMSKGKIQAEELRGQLGDRLPGAFQIMARSMNVTAGELDKMLKNGEVMADDVLPGFAAELRKTFNTDINMQIETTVSNFQRLLNEIRLIADAVGDELNPALASAASNSASMLAMGREESWWASGTAFLMGGLVGNPAQQAMLDAFESRRRQGEFARQQIEGTVFNIPGLVDQAVQPGGSTFYGPGTPGARSAIDLTSGVTEPDEKRMAALREEIALMGEKSEYAKTLWEYSEGELKNANHVERALALQAARMKDKAAADKEAADAAEKAAQALQKSREQELKQATELEEKERERVREAMTRNAILDEEIKAGGKITRAKRELIELEMQHAVVGNTTLRQELERADAIERAVNESREFYARLFKQMEQDAESSANQMSVFAERAAQNMQDSFAEFLFNPFEDGVDGMLRNFTETLQRMTAQAASAQFFDYLMPFITDGINRALAPAHSAYEIDFGSMPSDGTGPVIYKPGDKSALIDPNAATTPSVQVNVQNNSRGQVEASGVRTRVTPDGLVIDLIVRDLNENGPISQAMSRTYRMNRQPGALY